MSSLPPQALHINSMRIQAGESTGVLNKMKINKTVMMVKMKLFSFVVVIPGLPALRKRQTGVALAADVLPRRAEVRRRRISIL